MNFLEDVFGEVGVGSLYTPLKTNTWGLKIDVL